MRTAPHRFARLPGQRAQGRGKRPAAVFRPRRWRHQRSGAHFGKVVAKIPARRITEAAGRLIDLYREQRQSETGRPRSVLPAHRPVGSRRAAEGPRRARTRTRPLQTTSSTSAKARHSIRSLWMGSALHKSQILKSQIPSQDCQSQPASWDLAVWGWDVCIPSGGGAPWPTADEVRC